LLKAGFIMDDAQFKELCTRMKVGKSLSYQDFLDHFQRQGTGIYTDNTKATWVSTFRHSSCPSQFTVDEIPAKNLLISVSEDRGGCPYPSNVCG